MKAEETRELHDQPVVRPSYVRMAGGFLLMACAIGLMLFFLGRASTEPERAEQSPVAETEPAERLWQRFEEVRASLEEPQRRERKEQPLEPPQLAQPSPFAEPRGDDDARRRMETLRAVGESSLVAGGGSAQGREGSLGGGSLRGEDPFAERLAKSQEMLEEQVGRVQELQEQARNGTLFGQGSLRPGEIGTPARRVLEGAGALVLSEGLRARGSRTVSAGTALRGALVTAVNTDQGGTVVAQVTQDVFDRTFERVVIPRGSKLLADASQGVATGDQRVALAWTRLELPEGSYYELPGLKTADVQGAAGLRARVNNHYGAIYGRAILLSLIGAGLQLSQPERSVAEVRLSSGEVAAAAVGQELGRVSSELLRRGAERRPTLRLRAGEEILILLNRDLTLGGAR